VKDRYKMKKIGSNFMLDKTITIYDKGIGANRQVSISKKTAYRGLLRRGYHPLAEQQEWLKRQILYDK